VFIFIFATSINSLPHDILLEKRAKYAKFLQCPGDYPINYIQITYTPAVFVSDQEISETNVFHNTITIDSGVIVVINFYFNIELFYTNKTDYCQFFQASCP